jgi:putative membrane protein
MAGMPATPGAVAQSLLFAALLTVAAIGYPAAVVAARRRGRWWSPGRAGCWYAGLAATATALFGPLAAAGHDRFSAHMAGHLLLGMAAPLLLVMAGPITLTLRALPVTGARAVARLLRAWPMRLLTHPVTAAALDAGGLWTLYTTDLYPAMHDRPWLHLLIQAHVLGAGYLFTAAIIGVDPVPHRPGRPARAAVLIAFLAVHGVLAKHLYAVPPAGVSPAHAYAGAELMYYGGDLLDLVVIAVFCLQWYTATDPHRRANTIAPRISNRSPGRAWRLPDELRNVTTRALRDHAG